MIMLKWNVNMHRETLHKLRDAGQTLKRDNHYINPPKHSKLFQVLAEGGDGFVAYDVLHAACVGFGNFVGYADLLKKAG